MKAPWDISGELGWTLRTFRGSRSWQTHLYDPLPIFILVRRHLGPLLTLGRRPLPGVQFPELLNDCPAKAPPICKLTEQMHTPPPRPGPTHVGTALYCRAYPKPTAFLPTKPVSLWPVSHHSCCWQTLVLPRMALHGILFLGSVKVFFLHESFPRLCILPCLTQTALSTLTTTPYLKFGDWSQVLYLQQKSVCG